MQTSVQSNSVIPALSALALESRFAVVRLLTAVAPEGLPAGEIARRLNLRQNTMSDHLQILARSGLLVAERQSRSIIYRVSSSDVRLLIQSLQESLDPDAADSESSSTV